MAKSVKAFLEREDRLFFIVEMAKTKAITSADIIQSDPKQYSRSNVSLYFQWLVENNYLKKQRRANKDNGKSMWYYISTGKDYKKLSEKDYYHLGIGYKQKNTLTNVPIPATFKPHPNGRIIKLLDKPLPRPKDDGYAKKRTISIGSSFSLMV